MPVRIIDLYMEGAMEAAETIPLRALEEVKSNEIILNKGNDGYKKGTSKLEGYNAGDIVLLLSKEQALDFHSEILEFVKAYKIAQAIDIPQAKTADKDTTYESYMSMNPIQAEIYLSLGIDRLVAVKKADLERVFSYHKDVS